MVGDEENTSNDNSAALPPDPLLPSPPDSAKLARRYATIHQLPPHETTLHAPTLHASRTGFSEGPDLLRTHLRLRLYPLAQPQHRLRRLREPLLHVRGRRSRLHLLLRYHHPARYTCGQLPPPGSGPVG